MNLKDLLNLNEDSSSEEAHRLGYKSKGYGYWEKDGKVVAKTVNGKLVPVNKDSGAAPAAQNKTPNLAKAPAKNPDLKPTGMSAATAGKTQDNTPEKSDVLKGKTDSEKNMEKRDKDSAKQAEEMPQVVSNPHAPPPLTVGKPIDKLALKKIIPEKVFEANPMLDEVVIGEENILCDGAEWEALRLELNGHETDPMPIVRETTAEGDRQRQDLMHQLPGPVMKELNRVTDKWCASGQYARSSAQKAVENALINNVCAEVKPTVQAPAIYRGMQLPPEMAGDFLKNFRIGQDVDMEPSGFSTRGQTAVSYAGNGVRGTSVLLRMVPNSDGTLHGLVVSNSNSEYKMECEVIRPAGPKARCTNVRKIIRTNTGIAHNDKPVVFYVVDMEEQGYEQPQMTEAFTKEQRNPVFDNIMNTAFGFWNPKNRHNPYLTDTVKENVELLGEYDRAWRRVFRQLNEAKTAAETAHELGLHHVGWGYWANEQGIVVAKTVNGVLTKLEPNDELPPEGTSPDEWEKPAAPAPAPEPPPAPAPEKPKGADKNSFPTFKEYVAQLKANVSAMRHKLDDVISGKYPVGTTAKLENKEKAAAAGLYTTTVKGTHVIAKSEADAQKVVDFLQKGGKYGSTELFRLEGYSEDEVKEYVKYLKASDRYDLLGKGTGNQITQGGGGHSSSQKSFPGFDSHGSSHDWYKGGGYSTDPSYSSGYTSKPWNPETEPHTKPETKVPEGGIRFLKGEAVPAELNGIPFAPWTDAPKTNDDWAKVEGTNPDLKEDPLPLSLKPMSAGVIIREPDGRVWVVEPKNHYMGYEHTFPKGKAEKGLTLQQNAIKEAFEESGLKVKIVGFFGDYDRDTSVGRYYTAERVGGSPADFGWESHSVKLVPPQALTEMMNKKVDGDISKDIIKGKVAKATTAKEIMAEKVGGQAGSNQGGFFKGSDGVMRYVKAYKDPARSDCENLSNEIYRGLGLRAPKSQTFQMSPAQKAYASEIIDGKTLNNFKIDEKMAWDILDGFAADVLLSNWDTVGLANDNILIDKDGKPNRIDNGGTLLFRAMEKNGRKDPAVLDAIPEWEGFANPNINPTYANLFKIAGYKKPEDMGRFLVNQVKDIAVFRNKFGGWAKIVDHFAPTMAPDAKVQVVKMMEARTELMVQKSKALEVIVKKQEEEEKAKKDAEWKAKKRTGGQDKGGEKKQGKDFFDGDDDDFGAGKWWKKWLD